MSFESAPGEGSGPIRDYHMLAVPAGSLSHRVEKFSDPVLRCPTVTACVGSAKFDARSPARRPAVERCGMWTLAGDLLDDASGRLRGTRQ